MLGTPCRVARLNQELHLLVPRALPRSCAPDSMLSLSVYIWLIIGIILIPIAIFVYRFSSSQRISIRVLPSRVNNVSAPYAVSDTVGRRPYMEDRHVIGGELRGVAHTSLFAVFDGHGGASAADFIAQRLMPLLAGDVDFPSDPRNALSRAFLAVDDEFLAYARASRPPLDDGTTAIAALIVDNTIHVANAGDSRCILVHRSGRVEAMSDDHKPNRPDEIARIRALGGSVYFHGVWRVSGVLAVSRAIGDRILKPYVTALPEVTSHALGGSEKWLILATDGLWDVCSNRDVAAMAVGMNDAGKVAAKLVQEALDKGSADNITVLVVDLTRHAAVSRVEQQDPSVVGDAPATDVVVDAPGPTPAVSPLRAATEAPPSQAGRVYAREGVIAGGFSPHVRILQAGGSSAREGTEDESDGLLESTTVSSHAEGEEAGEDAPSMRRRHAVTVASRVGAGRSGDASSTGSEDASSDAREETRAYVCSDARALSQALSEDDAPVDAHIRVRSHVLVSGTSARATNV